MIYLRKYNMNTIKKLLFGSILLVSWFIIFFAFWQKGEKVIKEKVSIVKTDNKEISEWEKFAQAYTRVAKDNRFVFRTPEEWLNILEKWTGIVFFGFDSCKWCQKYAPYIDEIAKEIDISKIYYINIKEDRANNTETYQKIVKFLGENLLNDEEWKPRIFVPDVTIVHNGKILLHDNESSLATDKDWTPDEYWTIERETALKNKLREGMKKLPKFCSEGCNN